MHTSVFMRNNTNYLLLFKVKAWRSVFLWVMWPYSFTCGVFMCVFRTGICWLVQAGQGWIFFLWCRSFWSIWLNARSWRDAMGEDNKPALEGRDHSQMKTLHKSHSANGCCTQRRSRDTHTNPLKMNAYHNTALKQVNVHLTKMDRASSTIKCHSVWSALKAKLQVSCHNGNGKYVLGNWLLQRSQCQTSANSDCYYECSLLISCESSWQ